VVFVGGIDDQMIGQGEQTLEAFPMCSRIAARQVVPAGPPSSRKSVSPVRIRSESTKHMESRVCLGMPGTRTPQAIE